MLAESASGTHIRMVGRPAALLFQAATVPSNPAEISTTRHVANTFRLDSERHADARFTTDPDGRRGQSPG
jgi:predicted acetyltransferase